MKRAGLQKFKFSALVFLLLFAEITFFPFTSVAATSGSGACQQTYTVSGTGAVAVYENSGYCFVAFKNTGAVNSQAVFTWTRPSQVTNVDVLVVGGGGGGGARHGGGGGAGGFVKTDAYTISSASNIAIAVGAGGAASTSGSGTSGQNSYFKATTGSASGLIAIGGGAGSSGGSSGGGSSGGAGSAQSVAAVTSQTQSTFAGVTLAGINFGNVGASGAYDTNLPADNNDYWAGGGGGGAAGPGTYPLSNGTQVTSFANYSSSTARGGNGGEGKSVSWISPTVASNLSVGESNSGTVYFAGGGGGGIGVDGQSGGTGGLGGGATGTRTESSGNAGGAFTGGGGGGSGFDDISKAGSYETVSAAPAGAGGSGIVVLRFIAPDLTAPTVTVTTFSTSPGSDNWYSLGETVGIRLTFSETVTVSGSPRTAIVGLTGKYFTYSSGSGSTLLDFTYTVASGDINATGLGVALNTLQANSGTIRDAAANDAVLSNSALAANGVHRVDGVLPTLASASIASDGARVTLSFSETISSTISAYSAINVTVGSFRDVVSGGDPADSRLSMNLNFAATSGAVVTLSYTDPTAGNDASALQDEAGNDLASFSNFSVSNSSTQISNTTVALALNPSSLTATYRAPTSLRATVTAAGRVSFFQNGKIIVACRNIATTASSPFYATCSWKPSIQQYVSLKASYKSTTDGFTDSAAPDLRIYVTRRGGTR